MNRAAVPLLAAFLSAHSADARTTALRATIDHPDFSDGHVSLGTDVDSGWVEMSAFLSPSPPRTGVTAWGVRTPDGTVPFFAYSGEELVDDPSMTGGSATGWHRDGEQMYAWASLQDGRVKFGRYALDSEAARPVREIEYGSAAGLVPHQVSSNRTPWTDEFNFISLVEDLGDRFHLVVLDPDLAVVIDRTYTPDFLQTSEIPGTSRFTVVEKSGSSGFYVVAAEAGEAADGLHPIHMSIISLTKTGDVLWARRHTCDSRDDDPLFHALALEDGSLVTALKESDGAYTASVLTLHQPDGALAWSTRVNGADLVLEHHQPTGTYPFASSGLLWVAGEGEHPERPGADRGLLLAFGAGDGRISRQVQFDPEHPGRIGITRLTDGFIYLNRLEFLASTSPPFQLSYNSGLYRMNLTLDSMTGVELENTDAAWLVALPTDDGRLQTDMGYRSRRETIVWNLSPELEPDCENCGFFNPVGRLASPSGFTSTPLQPALGDGNVEIAPGNSTFVDSSIKFVELPIVTEVVGCQDVLPDLEVLPVGDGDRALLRRRVDPGVGFSLRRSDDMGDFGTILESGIGDGRVHPYFDTVVDGTGFWRIEFQ